MRRSRIGLASGLLAAGVVGAVVWYLGRSAEELPSPHAPLPVPVARSPGPVSPEEPSAPAVAREPAPLARGEGVLVGRLVRGTPPVPVPGRVVVADAAGRSESLAVDPSGLFRMEGLPTGSLLAFEATSPGLLPCRFPEVRIHPRAPLDLGDIRMGPGSRLAFEVVDGRARPVAGATVTVHRRPLDNGPWDPVAGTGWGGVAVPAAGRGETDGRGLLALEGLPPGEWRVRVTAAGFASKALWARTGEGLAAAPVRAVLLPARSLHGRILSGESPVAGATAIATSADFRREVRSSETGPDGTYSLEGLEPGDWTLAVRPRPDLRVEIGTLPVPGPDPFDLRLPPGGRIHGTVVDDATGRPIPGAFVAIQIDGDRLLDHAARATAGPLGEFDLEGLPAGEFDAAGLTVEATGYLPIPDGRPDPVVAAGVVAPGSDLALTLRLRRGAAVSGRVLDPDGRPVPGARVSLFHPVPGAAGGSEGGYATPAVLSAIDGSWRIPLAEPGRGLLRVTADGWYQPGYPGDAGEAMREGTAPEAWIVEVSAGGETTRDLVLSRGGTVEGTVVDADGAPAAGLWVSASEEGNWDYEVVEGLTDAKGGFRLSGLAPGVAIRVEAGDPRGGHGISETFPLAEGEVVVDCRVVVRGPGVLAGTIRREDGQALRSPRLRIVDEAPEGLGVWRLALIRAPFRAVGMDGSFRADDLGPGTWTVLAEDEGCAFAPGPTVFLEEGGALEGVEAVLPPEKAIAGRVVDGRGAPLRGVPVLLTKDYEESGAARVVAGLFAPLATTLTDEAGTFRQGGLADGPYIVTVRVPGTKERSTRAGAGATDVLFTVERGLSIAGRVVDGESGTPIAGIDVTAYPAGPHEDSMEWETMTAGDGTFLLDALPAGSVDLSFRHGYDGRVGGYGARVVKGVAAGSTGVQVTLTKGLAIAGRVVDEEGRPFTGDFTIQVMGRDDAGEHQFASVDQDEGGDGTFRVGSLPPGSYSMGVLAFPDHLTTELRGVRSGTEGVVVTLRRAARISGRVVDGNARPVPEGVPVRATAVGVPGEEEGADESDRTEMDGTFEIRMLGPFRFRVVAGGGNSEFTPAAVDGDVPAGSKGLEIRVTRGVPIAGTLRDGAGATPEGTEIRAVAGDVVLDWVRVSDDGDFVLRGVPAGRVILQSRTADEEPRRLGEFEAPAEGLRLTLPGR